jgi:outer membrane autotransporter protein
MERHRGRSAECRGDTKGGRPGRRCILGWRRLLLVFLSALPVTAPGTASAQVVSIARAATNNGDGQRDVVGAPLEPFVAVVTTPVVFGNQIVNVPVPNQSVGWRVASGTGTLASVTTTTDANGLTRNTLTLGQTPGDVVVNARLPIRLAPGNPAPQVTFNAQALPPNLSVVSGDNQTGLSGTPLPQPLVVAITANGRAVVNRTVSWRVTSGSATLATDSTSTNGRGQTQNTLTLGATPGPVVVTAFLEGVAGVPATFSAVVLPRPIPTLTAVFGDNQSGAPGTALAQPLVVALTANGNPLGGRVVTWQVTSGAATLASNTSGTNGNGQAENRLTLGATPGPVVVTATVGDLAGATTTFNATVQSSTLTVVSGNNQSGPPNAALAQPLVVAVRANGQSLAERVVSWQVTSGSGTLATATSSTNGTGQAQNRLTLGGTPGPVVVTASVAGLSGATGTFTATVLGANLAIVSGNNQIGIANATLPQPLVVAVTSNGQPLFQQPVSWQVTSGSGTLTASSTTTDATGHARTTLTLGATTGPVVVTASLLGASVAFTVNNATQAAAEGLKSYAVLGNVAVLTTTVQIKNLAIRLASLRRGAKGVSLDGLAFAVEDKSVPLGAMASLVPGVGGRSRPEESDAFGKPGAMASLVPGVGGRSRPEESDAFGKLGIFLNGQGSFGDQDRTSREPGFGFHTAGLTFGVDYRFTDQLILGVAGGYMSDESNLDASAGTLDTRGASVSLFGTYYLADRYYVDAIGTYGWNSYDTARKITFAGSTATANADPDGRQFAVSVESGYDFNLRAWTLGLHGRVTYINVDIDGFRERDAGLFNLQVSGQKVESLTTALGASLSYTIDLPWAILLPTVIAEWEHEYKNNSRLISGTLTADPTQSVFAFPTNDPDRNYFNLGAGISATFKRWLSAFAFYETVVGRQNFTVHSFTAGVRFDF